MIPLLIIATTFVLLAGFVGLTYFESTHGMRIAAPQRERFDRTILRAHYVLTHIDYAAFLKDETQHTANRLGHGVARVILRAVRAAERFLARLVHRLRTKIEPRHADTTAPRKSNREFVQKLSDFKGELKATPPDISDIQ